MRFKIFAILILALVFTGCNKNETPQEEPQVQDGSHKVVVEEVVNASAYTYLKVSENGSTNWLAITRREVKEGATLYYNQGMEMKNFKSRDLDRVFESVFFVQDISNQPLGMGQKPMQTSPHGAQKKADTKENISVDKAEGGITIAELFSNRKKYEGKVVKIKGKVTKYNGGIMNRNWIHIQDGSKAGDAFDLTITTDDAAKVGDIITVEGKIILNKDFGYGYSYEVLMEEAKLFNKNV